MQGLSTARDRGDPVGADGLMGQRSARAALIYLHAREERGRAIADGIDKMVISVTNVGDRWAGRLPRQTSRPPRARRAIGRTEWHATGSQACWPSTCDDAKSVLPAQTFGAGDGDRTRTTSLEGWGSTIELRPLAPVTRVRAQA